MLKSNIPQFIFIFMETWQMQITKFIIKDRRLSIIHYTVHENSIKVQTQQMYRDLKQRHSYSHSANQPWRLMKI